jgi:hypothetical protein
MMAGKESRGAATAGDADTAPSRVGRTNGPEDPTGPPAGTRRDVLVLSGRTRRDVEPGRPHGSDRVVRVTGTLEHFGPVWGRVFAAALRPADRVLGLGLGKAKTSPFDVVACRE